jgi:hypothetical protein
MTTESESLLEIHRVTMNVAGDWYDRESDTLTVRHVKWMARELNRQRAQRRVPLWRRALHWLAHRLRLIDGIPEPSFSWENGEMMVGFRCNVCDLWQPLYPARLGGGDGT